MPKQVSDIRTFLNLARQKDAKVVKIKKSPDAVKFKLRLSRYLVTLSVTDMAKAEKIKATLPNGLKKEDL